MPNQTPNYNLVKPLTTENYDVNVFNGNADIIDTTLKSIDTQLNDIEKKTQYSSKKYFDNLSITDADMSATDFATNIVTLFTALGAYTNYSIYAYETNYPNLADSITKKLKDDLGTTFTSVNGYMLEMTCNANNAIPNKIFIYPNGSTRIFYISYDSTIGYDNDISTAIELTKVDSGWINLPLNSQVTAYGSSTVPKCRKIDNMVEIRGAIKISGDISSSSGLNFATLPVGFRPSHTIGVVCEGSGVSKWYLNISNDSGALNVDRYSENGSTMKTTFTGNEWLPFQCTFFIN